VLLGLTTDQKFGLAGTAAVFIVFSLVCALWIPRYRPDFPGPKGLGLFIVLTAILTVAMLGAVEVWAIEEEEHAAETTTEPAETETTETETTETETTETETETTETETAPATTEEEQPAGDPAAGEALFASEGCGACHTFAAAGATGTVGPNLDESLEGQDAEFVRQSIVEPDAEIAEGYQAGVMPSFERLSDEQVGDLVAFLTAS
jgi:mono/diheme cytochrome c family protein